MRHDPMCDVPRNLRMLMAPWQGCERCMLIERVRFDALAAVKNTVPLAASDDWLAGHEAAVAAIQALGDP